MPDRPFLGSQAGPFGVRPMPLVPTTSDAFSTAVLFAVKAAAVGGAGAGSLHLICSQHRRRLKYPMLHKTPDPVMRAEYGRQLATDRERSVAAFALGAASGTLGAVPLLVHCGSAPFLQVPAFGPVCLSFGSPLCSSCCASGPPPPPFPPIPAPLAQTPTSPSLSMRGTPDRAPGRTLQASTPTHNASA